MPTIRALLAPPGRQEAGTTTAEYAVGTVAAACIGCILVYLAQGDHSFFFDFLSSVYETVSSVVPFADGFPGPHRPWLM